MGSEQTRQGRRSKYAPLGTYLRGRPDARVILTPATIAILLGIPLPPSARTPGWWHNRAHGGAQARAWLGAGWRVDGVQRGGAVTFVRAADVAGPTKLPAAAQRSTPTTHCRSQPDVPR